MNDVMDPDIRRTCNDVHKVVALGATLMDRGLQLLRSNVPVPARDLLAALRKKDWWVAVVKSLVDYAEATSAVGPASEKDAAGTKNVPPRVGA